MLYHTETGAWHFNGSQWFHLEGWSSSGPLHHSPHDTVSHLWSLKSSVPLLQAQILQLHSQFLHDSHKKLTHFPCSPASSINLLNSSLRSLILFLFSLRSSSARSFTYFSNTCFLSLDVSSRYLGSKTILCSSFSHVLNAETCNIQYRKCFTLTSTANCKSARKVHPITGQRRPRGTEVWLYSFFNLSIRWGAGGQHYAPSRFNPGKDPVPIIEKAGWAPGLNWTGVENLAPTGIQPRDCPTHNKSLCQLRYPGSSKANSKKQEFLFHVIYPSGPKRNNNTFLSSSTLSLTWALDGGQVVNATPPAALPPGKTQYSLQKRLAGPQGWTRQVRKISPPPPPGFNPQTVQPIASRCTNYAILAPLQQTVKKQEFLFHIIYPSGPKRNSMQKHFPVRHFKISKNIQNYAASRKAPTVCLLVLIAVPFRKRSASDNRGMITNQAKLKYFLNFIILTVHSLLIILIYQQKTASVV